MSAERKYRFRLKFLLQEIDLAEGVFIIGRSPSCNLTLKDPLVSRRHARISISKDQALLDDLGSRNGTLVNDEPVFENRRLWHSDNIRIGSNNLGFVREKHYPFSQSAVTMKCVTCPECGDPYRDGEPSCPSCSSPLVPDNICHHCRIPVLAGARFCHRCGETVGRDDSTIPVELGGAGSGWTPEIIDDVIKKALSNERYEQAARLLDGRIEDLEKQLSKREMDVEELTKLTEFNLEIAKGLKNPSRLKWVTNRWRVTPFPMPLSLVKNLEKAAGDWYDVGVDLKEYLADIESRTGDAAVEPENLALLREAINDLE